MIDETEALKEKKLRRFAVLRELYLASGEDKHKIFDVTKLGAELGFDDEESTRIGEYLTNEGLAHEHLDYGIHISIAHRGIVEYEEAVLAPEKPTHYFPPVISVLNIHSSTITGSQINQSGME